MYTRLSQHKTRIQYRQLIEETTQIVNGILQQIPDNRMFKSILAQINDIKERVVDAGETIPMIEYLEHYSLGAIAIREFDSDDELRQRLSDIYGGGLYYNDMPEE